MQLRGSPSSPYPATSRVPSRLAEPQELLYWEMPAAGTADTVFSLVSYPGAIAQLCFHKHTLKSTSLRTAKEGTAVGASFERVPLWAAGDGGKSLIGGPQGGCRVPREGAGSPGCCQPPVPPATAIRACCQGWLCKPGPPLPQEQDRCGCFSIHSGDTGAVPTALPRDAHRWAILARRGQTSEPPTHIVQCCFGDSNTKNHPGAFSFW